MLFTILLVWLGDLKEEQVFVLIRPCWHVVLCMLVGNLLSMMAIWHDTLMHYVMIACCFCFRCPTLLVSREAIFVFWVFILSPLLSEMSGLWAWNFGWIRDGFGWDWFAFDLCF
jgi:hypothetical protein